MKNKTIKKAVSCFTASMLFFITACQANTDSSGDFNLNFQLETNKPVKAWRIDGLARMQIDSTEQINGKYPAIFQNTEINSKLRHLMIGTFQQQLLLPDIGDAATANISFTCKSVNLTRNNFAVTVLDSLENALYADTINALTDGDWKTFSFPLSLKDAAFLHLSVALQGKDFLSEQALWLDRIEIKVDGKNMAHFPAKNLIREPLKMEDITPLSFTDSTLYDRIPELKTKRIFALGETVHGSGSIFDAAFQIAKHQVEKNSCRLILLELPIEDMLSVNRFIQGDASFEIDSLMFRYFNFAYYGTDLKKMFLWLKAYNKRNSEKVWIMGMDYEYRKEESIMSLYDYLYAINQSLQSPAIDSLCYHVLTAIGNSSKVEEFLQLAESLAKRKDIASLIGEKEFEIFRHVLTVSGKYGASTAKRLDSRDSVMYENTDFLLNFLCNKDEKAFVLAHFGHVNYKGLPVIPNRHHISFGSLMKENYGTDYFCTGVLVGTGDFATTGDSTITIRPLQSPPLGSLEYLFGQARNNYFYIPESAIPQPIACIRLIGNVDSEEAFKPWSVRSRMDAAIYIQNSKASAIPSEIQDNPDILRGRNPSVMMSRLTKYFERDRICNLKMQQRVFRMN